jgi:cytochrome c553
MSVYGIALFCHSYLRWVVLGAALFVVGRSLWGWRSSRPWTAWDARAHRGFVGLLDLQFLLGVVLYLVLSPISAAFFADPASGMKDSVLRFFGVEHVFAMTIAVGAVHIGSTRAKKAVEPRARHRRVWISVLVGLGVMLVAIPWPFAKYGRPLARTATGESADAPDSDAAGCPPTYARCAPCHGDRGGGDGLAAVNLVPKPRDFADPAWGQERTDEDLAAIIRDGGAPHGLSVLMPPHRDLSEQEIEALVACVRTLQREGGGGSDAR